MPNREAEELDISNTHLIDINKYRFNNRLTNLMSSTCPVTPKYHSTFGIPIDR